MLLLVFSLLSTLVRPPASNSTRPNRAGALPAPRTMAKTATDCRASLVKAVQLLHPPQNKRPVAHLQFVSHTYFRTPGQSKIREVSTPATLYTKGQQLYFATPQTIIWQDGQYSAVIMHSQQTIYLTRTSANKSSSGLAQFEMLQDSLIQRAQVLQCQSITEAGKGYQKMVLILAPKDRARYGVATLGIKLDDRDGIRELTIVHPTGDLVSQVVYTIEKQEFLASSAQLPRDARAKVVDKKSHPLAPYRGYQVVDHTKLSHLPY